MKQSIYKLIDRNGNLLNGLIAICFVGAVALGCTCAKGLDFGNSGSSSNSNSLGSPFNTSPE
ncbi:MAG: hypothetical protein ACRD6X_20465, partial [Pyrinomonadaceae bacterium]